MLGGLILAALEMVVPGAFLLWIGLAAAGTGLLTLLGIGLHWQVVAFLLLAAVLIGLMARRRPALDRVNAPEVGLVGQTCRAIVFAGGEGRVSLGDGQWQARLEPPETEVQPGTLLRVTGLAGTVLVVGRAP